MFAARYFAPRYFAPRYWPEGSGVAAPVVEQEHRSTGGQRYGSRKLTPLVTHGRVVPRDGSLYNEMFPEKSVPSTTVERTDSRVPVALLLAFMAGFDD